jgi:thiamine-phosphate pyrophosphorylase
VLRGGEERALSQALSVGVKFFQYRSKSDTRKHIYETALRLASMARCAGALFIVNDHADIAVAVDADGVHLGQDDLPIASARKLLGKKKVVGVSTHSVEQAMAAEAAGADYIGFGPLFATQTKDAGAVQGLGALALLRKSVAIPIIAIGGIKQTNIRETMHAGANGVAVISAVLSAADIQKAAEEMILRMQE